MHWLLSWAIWFIAYWVAADLHLERIGRKVWPKPHFGWERRCEAMSIPANRSGTRVLLANVGQTGTTSVIDALRVMGLNSFHNSETLMYAPLINTDNPKPIWWRHYLDKCGVDAISLEPQVDAWWVAFISDFPASKIVLTWRSFPSWAKSTVAANDKDKLWDIVVKQFVSGTRVLPWLYAWEVLTGGLSHVYAQGAPVSGQVSQPSVAALFVWYAVAKELFVHGSTLDRGTYKMDGQEAYLAHLNEVFTNVHPNRLLVFDIRKHGWSELGQFLNLPTPAPGTPMPHPRSKRSWTNDEKVQAHPRIACCCCFIFIAIHVVNCIVIKTMLVWLWRAIGCPLVAAFGRSRKSSADHRCGLQ